METPWNCPDIPNLTYKPNITLPYCKKAKHILSSQYFIIQPIALINHYNSFVIFTGFCWFGEFNKFFLISVLLTQSNLFNFYQLTMLNEIFSGQAKFRMIMLCIPISVWSIFYGSVKT
jgi:hypothetical protein